MVQLSYPYMITGKTIALTIQTFVSKVMSLLFLMHCLCLSPVKNLLAMLETPVQSLGQKNPLEKGMTTHSSILAWRIPWTERPTVHGVAKSWTPLSDYHNRFVKAFLPRSKRLLISWLQSPSCSDFGAQENKVCHCFHCFHIYLQ